MQRDNENKDSKAKERRALVFYRQIVLKTLKLLLILYLLLSVLLVIFLFIIMITSGLYIVLSGYMDWKQIWKKSIFWLSLPGGLPLLPLPVR